MENKKPSVFEDVAIGATIDFDDVKLIVKPGSTCAGCYFSFCMGRCHQMVCSYNERADQTDIIFAKIDDNYNPIKKERNKTISSQQIINLIQAKYEATNNELYLDLLKEINKEW